MSHLYAWLELAPHQINPQQLSIGIQESDSHYHMKYPHRQASEIKPPQRHDIPPRIQAQIESAYAWFYQSYYPKG
jgi:sulfotransferase